MSNFDRTIAIIAALASVISAAAAILACRLQLRKPRRAAVFVLGPNWTCPTVTITNVGDITISVARIFFDFNGDGMTVKCPTIEHSTFSKLPYNLKRGAAVRVDYPAFTTDAETINIKTRLILELADGARLICKNGILG